ncbi:MAG TPA: hypothetical protein VJN70_17815 [Gemmatimonadaceae bacterium]|nr:hypothetical protein [Gemmatimonadaceae bacterium]
MRTAFLLSRAPFIAASFMIETACLGAQQPVGVASDTSVVGAYDFWFTPGNNEPISGRLVLSRRLGHFTAIVTSPKLSEPEPADSVSVTNGTVFLSFFAGQFTFTFRVSGDTISDSRFTKSIRGVSEEGRLDLKRGPPGRRE